MLSLSKHTQDDNAGARATLVPNTRASEGSRQFQKLKKLIHWRTLIIITA